MNDMPPSDSPSGASRDERANSYAGYEDEVELLDYILVLARRRWLIVGLTVAAMAATFGHGTVSATLQHSIRAVLLVAPVQEQETLSAGPQNVARFTGLLESLPLAIRVARADYELLRADSLIRGPLATYLGLPDENQAALVAQRLLDVTSQKGGGILELEIESANRDLALQVLGAYIDRLQSYDRELRQRSVAARIRFVRDRLDTVSAELAAAESDQSRFLRDNRSLLGDDVGFIDPDLSVRHGHLQRLVDTKSALHRLLLERYEAARIATAPLPSPIEVLVAPMAIDAQSNLLKRIILAGIVGGMAAVVLAFLLEYWKRSTEAGKTDEIRAVLGEDIQKVRRLFSGR